jgi:hypothetical protein
MAVHAADGTRHHSASRAALHDRMASNKGPSSGVKQMAGKAEGMGSKGPGHMPGPAETPTKTPIEDHVSEHGPAHSMMYQQSGGMHHVSSFHGDAKPGEMDHPHAHHSVHKSEMAAHEHMGKSMGMDHEEEERPEMEGDETPDSMQDQESGSRGIPGLA